MREHQGGRQGAASAVRKGPAAPQRERVGGGREQAAKGSGAEAKAKILAKLRRLHPMD